MAFHGRTRRLLLHADVELDVGLRLDGDMNGEDLALLIAQKVLKSQTTTIAEYPIDLGHLTLGPLSIPVHADFKATLGQIETKLQANPVAIQLPIGSEDKFKGVVDLVRMKAITYKDETMGADYIVEDIPAELEADAKIYREKLIEKVSEVDDKILAVFTEAYTDVAREFETVFATLFPGGEGRLVLTDPSDMLTTGIEVEARPPGKKVKRLSLLSGGERSLTAMALLVAIFRG